MINPALCRAVLSAVHVANVLGSAMLTRLFDCCFAFVLVPFAVCMLSALLTAVLLIWSVRCKGPATLDARLSQVVFPGFHGCCQ